MKEYKLKELIEIGNGTRYSHLEPGEIPLYGSGGIMSFVDDYLYDGEAILLPRKGTLTNIMYTEGKIWTVDTMYYAEVNKLANPYYLYRYLSLLNLKHLDSGSALPSMTKWSYNNIEVLLPSLEVQNEVAILLKSLDAKIELNNKINQELEAMAKTLYDYWFVQFDFPAYLSGTLSGVEGYKSSGGKMVYNEELKREIPEGWQSGKFETIATIVGGSTPSRAVSENFTKNKHMPWITPKDLSANKGNKFITRGELDVTEIGMKNTSLRVMPKNTVLLSSRAPIGYLAISREKVTTNQGFKSFVPHDKYSTEFVFYCVKNEIPKIEAYSTGSTFKEVSTTTLKTIYIAIPDSKTLDSYNQISKPIFKKQNIIELENQKLVELRDWLLPMLMNGQVTVGEAYAAQEEVLGMVAEEGATYGKEQNKR